ncbi:TPA: type II secretion system minor pseudopilin GspH [Salmonella enterica subsp. enterica serovar Virchow]
MVRHGFTILELTLVLFLISLIFSVVIPTLSISLTSPTQKEAERFIALLRHYRERADAINMALGIYWKPESYTFVQRYQGEWKPVPLSRLATTVKLNKPVSMILEPGQKSEHYPTEHMQMLLSHRLELYDMLSGLNLSSDGIPQIYFLPAEPAMPFVARFSIKGSKECWLVVMDKDELRSVPCVKTS